MTRSKEKSDNESRTSRSTIDIPVKLSRLRKRWGHKEDKLELSKLATSNPPKVETSKIKRWIKMKPTSKKESSERVVLFQHKNCKIVGFQDAVHNTNSGSHLGQGVFTIYAIYQEPATYLHCGSVIYPLLAKSKVLRIAQNRFILSLYNPERYWQITLMEDISKSDELAKCFESVCSYFDMYDVGEKGEKESEKGGEKDREEKTETEREKDEQLSEEIFSTGESTVIHRPIPVKVGSREESFDCSSPQTGTPFRDSPVNSFQKPLQSLSNSPEPPPEPCLSRASSVSSLDEALDLMSTTESGWMQPYEPRTQSSRKVYRRTSWALAHYASVHDFNT